MLMHKQRMLPSPIEASSPSIHQLQPWPQVLVYLRVHATPSEEQHANLSATLSLAGAGFIFGAGVDSELAALSVNTLRGSLELRASDARVSGSLQALQVDDQSLDAMQPVVLGPAGVVTKGALQPLPQNRRTGEQATSCARARGARHPAPAACHCGVAA
jgi:hypothetical protein